MQWLTSSQLLTDHGERRSYTFYFMKDFRWLVSPIYNLMDFKNDT